jgi:transcriptional regulator with XRE-family HTH domain
MTGIGEAAGIPASTVSRLLRGRTTEATIKAVASALRIPEELVLAQMSEQSLGPWEPPLDAHLLTSQEREALGVIIRGLVQSRGGTTDAGNAEAQKIPLTTRAHVGWAARRDANNRKDGAP